MAHDVPAEVAAHGQALGGHCVDAVGYDDGQQRFIVRNSWGTGWGMLGYCTMPYAYLTDANHVAGFLVQNEIKPTPYGPVLFDGTKISSPADLRAALLQRRESFLRTLTDRLLTYRGPGKCFAAGNLDLRLDAQASRRQLLDSLKYSRRHRPKALVD